MRPEKPKLDNILTALYTMIPLVPQRYKGAVLAGLTFLTALVGALYTTDTTPFDNAPATYLASAITYDQETGAIGDVTMKVRKDGKGEAQQIAAAGTSPAVELMTWENLDVREGATQVWCLAEADAEAQEVFREVMNDLSARWENINWTESCGRHTYTFGPSAQTDCGIGDRAVACAAYLGRRSGRVSYNGNYRDFTLSSGARGINPGLARDGVRIATAHEVGHLQGNLDHNDCDVPFRSAMTALFLPYGPSCSNPPAFTTVDEDYEKAIPYYNLRRRDSPTPTPTATPVPTRTRPTPSPTPVPTPLQGIQVWSWNGTDWKLDVITFHPNKDPNLNIWVMFGNVLPDGSFEQKGTFQSVSP